MRAPCCNGMGNPSMTDNYYSLLGVARDATSEEVLAAYAARLRQMPVDDPAVQQLDEAMDVLTHPTKRRRYDVAHGLEHAQKSGFSGREWLFGVLGVLAGMLVLSGVWIFSDRSNLASLPQVTEVTPYTAPVFTLNNLDGQDVSLSDFKGNVVLLNFWATWCEPCKAETPALQRAYQELQNEGLVIVGVDLFNTERSQSRGLDDVRRFVARFGVTYPVVLDETGTVSRSYAIAPIPTSYVIDQQGKVRYVKVGQLTTSEVERLFRSLQANGG